MSQCSAKVSKALTPALVLILVLGLGGFGASHRAEAAPGKRGSSGSPREAGRKPPAVERRAQPGAGARAAEEHVPRRGAAQGGGDGGVGAGGSDFGGRENRSIGIEHAGFGEREEPLDVVVDGFEFVVAPGENFGQGAAFGIGSVAPVEIEPGSSHRYSRC